MNKNNKLHKFSLSPYPRVLWIAISTNNFSDTLEGVSNYPKNAYAVVDDAYNPTIKKGGILIRFKSKKAMDVDTIAHESSHAAMKVCDYIGAKIDLQNQEYFSYLVGYIAKCCEEVKKYKQP